jgi:proteasome lid subunit RPN8/RPN11
MTSAMSTSRSIAPAILEDIYRHARATFPDECCGYIVGVGEDARLVACENRQNELHEIDPKSHPRTAKDGYEIAGRELLDLVRSFDTDSPATIIYHSHPLVGAYFSAEDTRAALAAGYPVDYLVVDVQESEVVEAVLFRRDAADQYVAVDRFPGAKV